MMVYTPAASVEVVSVATPPLNKPVPRIADPLLKVTVSPLGGVPDVELTVAVNVTAWPTNEGFSEEFRVVVVEAMIFWFRIADVLPVLFASPVYFAVMA